MTSLVNKSLSTIERLLLLKNRDFQIDFMHNCAEGNSLQINSFLIFSVVLVIKVDVLSSRKFSFHVVAKFADVMRSVFNVVDIFFPFELAIDINKNCCCEIFHARVVFF